MIHYSNSCGRDLLLVCFNMSINLHNSWRQKYCLQVIALSLLTAARHLDLVLRIHADTDLLPNTVKVMQRLFEEGRYSFGCLIPFQSSIEPETGPLDKAGLLWWPHGGGVPATRT